MIISWNFQTLNFKQNTNMNNTYSRIDIYEKGEYQNAFPLRIYFWLDFRNFPEIKNEKEACEYINNNASSFGLNLANKYGLP